MSAKNVKPKSVIKKRKQTTLAPLSTLLKASLDGTDTSSGYIAEPLGSKSYVLPVTTRKQKKKDNKGKKYDNEKPTLAYIPKAALYAEGMAFKYGADKYDAWNYKHGISVTRTLSAALRHITQFLAGETTDKESNVHHLGCARANLAMSLDTLENHPKFDDRFKGNKK